MEQIMNYIAEHGYTIATIILAIYELVARQIPTEGNWSLIHLMVKALDAWVANKKTTTTEGVTEEFTVAAVIKKEEVIAQETTI